MSNMTSQEQAMKAAVQSQLARIKKEEEEEELWISGEELYTEGSSDEEECTTQSTLRRKVNSNQSSHISSTDTHSTETKVKVSSTSVPKSNNTEGHTPKVPKNTSTPVKTSSPPVTESPQILHHPVGESPTVVMKNTNSSDFPTDWDEIDDAKISWKTKRERETMYESADIDNTMVALKRLRSLKQLSELDTRSLESRLTEESFDNESQNEIDSSATDVKEEYIERKILDMKNLDNLIWKMNDRVKKAREETLICQCENRKRLKNILSASPSETGKLAENTQLFLQLCPTYITLSAELRLKYEKNDSTAAKIESDNDNVSNISIGANGFNPQTFRNEDTMNLSYLHNSSNDFDLELFNNAENESWRVTNSTSDVERVIDEVLDSDINPYVVDEETKNVLLEVDKNISVYRKDFRNDRGQFMKPHDSVFNASIVISTVNSVPTMKSLQDTDKNLLDEVIKEARIIDPSSILNVAEVEINKPFIAKELNT
nr:uncharacterized protein LOC116426448 isoform X2 [Nomia melanderi]